jgi:hypothetical protein
MADAEKPESENIDGFDEENAGEEGGWGVVQYTMIFSGVLAGIILLIFLVGFVFAIIGDPDDIGPRVALIRDLFIIVVALEMILIVAALAILALQIAKLVNLVQSETKPILKNTQDTVNTAKGTARFVSSNLIEPVVQVGSFLAGVRVFLREAGGIRRALRSSSNGSDKKALKDGD